MDRPPAVAYLMNETLPDEFLDTHAERHMTTFNGVYAGIAADRKDAVLCDLTAMGYSVVEEPRLHELVNVNFLP